MQKMFNKTFVSTSMARTIIISCLFGFVLLLAILIAFALVHGDSSNISVIRLSGSDMILQRGNGYTEGNQLVITETDEKQRIRIISQHISFKAEEMPFMAWTFSEFSPRANVWVGWVAKNNPGKLNTIPAIIPLDSTAVYRMKDYPNWKGDIIAFGLGFDRQMFEPVILESVEVRPYSTCSMLESIWDELTAFESWTLRSINTIKGGYSNAIFRPVPVAFLWVILSFATYRFLQIKNANKVNRHAFITFSIIGWLILDVLWQINLFRQNYLTYHLYAGKTLQEKRLAGPDATIYAFSKEIRKYLPDSRARILLTGKGLLGNVIYEQPRLQYFLLPHNVTYLENNFALYSKSLDEYNYKFNIGGYLRTGNYLLVSGHDDRIVYDQLNNRLIIGKKYRFIARLRYKSNYGALYYIIKKERNNS